MDRRYFFTKVFIVGLTIRLVGQLLFEGCGVKGVWYNSDALAWLVCILAARENLPDRKYHDVLTFFVGLAINNLFDEIFFDPTRLHWNEAVFALIGLLWLIYKTRKKWREKK